jgi:hypothetical protein
MNRKLLAAFLVLILAPCLYAKNNRHGGRGKASTGGLNISTTSLPAGTVGAAYSQTLTAAGGTAPYTWAITGGAQPPALVLGLNTGTLAGTPTAAGTFSFIATVTDSAAHTYPFAFGLTIAGAGGATLFSDGLESGCLVARCQGTSIVNSAPYFPAWDVVNCGTGSYCPAVQNTIKHSGTYAYEQEYYICGDPTNPACGGSSQDMNRNLEKRFSSFGYPAGLSHYFVRFYVYYKTPEADATTGKIIQRKTARFWTQLTTNVGEWLEDAWNYDGGFFDPTHTDLTLAAHNASDVSYQLWGLASLNYDTWYCVEQEALLNTPGVADGTYRLWVDGVLKYQNTAISLRGIGINNTISLQIGTQVNRSSYFVVHEKRYFDDVKISTAYIGP